MNLKKYSVLKNLKYAVALLALPLLLATPGCKTGEARSAAFPAVESKGAGVYPEGSVVARHGRLHIEGPWLCDESGHHLVLKGISTHDFDNGAKYVNDKCIAFLANDWGVTVMRAAMYVDDYQKDPSIERYVDELVDACEKSGIYCIIDWHILSEHNPAVRTDEAMAFFARKAQQYSAKKHVIYEICNEPNGDDVKWATDVKPYAEDVIPLIRRYDKNSIIVVGTPSWSQDVDRAAKMPLLYGNVMYAFHFYAGTHGGDIKTKLRGAFNRIPVFCTEWGTTNADGNGGPFEEQSDAWMDMIEGMGISWCNWSLSDIDSESSSLLKSGANPEGGWSDADLTASGIYVRERLRK